MSVVPNSIADIISQLGIEIASVGDTEIAAKCPFHPDSHPSFSVSIVPKRNDQGEWRPAGLWVCYQCGQSGNINRLVELLNGEKIGVAAYLREIKRKEIRTKAVKEAEPEPEELPLEPVMLYARYETFGRPPVWALEERFISNDTANTYGVKWDKGWVIPIWDPGYITDTVSLWGWQFKRLDFVSNYPKQVKKSQTLFGLRETAALRDANELRSQSLVLVESPLDVCRLAEVGIPAVAAYGAFISRTQINLLISNADRITLALDSDEEGQRQQEKIYPTLARLMPTRKVVLPRGAKDPGDLSDAQALKVFTCR
jgi:DNA primase